MPVVMLEGEGGDYWRQWEQWTIRGLLDRSLISPEDVNLYYIARDPADGADHVVRFYRNYHSSRYVRDDLVIRLKRRLKEEDVARLAHEFAVLVKQGTMTQRPGPLEGEDEYPDLPRVVFHHTRHKFGLLRKLIDRINDCDPA
jgi:hypothetical protein